MTAFVDNSKLMNKIGAKLRCHVKTSVGQDLPPTTPNKIGQHL